MKTLIVYMLPYWKYLLGIIICYAVFLRIYKLGESSMWIDEGFSSYSSISGVNMAYYIHNLSQLLSFWVFGVSDWSARFPSVVFSLVTIPIIYFITEKLFKNTYVSALSVFIFLFAHIEIAWARQARFYTLLQFLFYAQILFIILFSQKKSVLYWCLGALLCYIGIFFHPFLYTGVVIFLGATLILAPQIYHAYQKKGFLYHWKEGIAVFTTLGGIIGHHIITQSGSVYRHLSESRKLSEFMQEKYIEQYSSYLYGESGILYILFFLGLMLLAYKKRFLELIIFAGGFCIAFYAISQKGFLFHYRYVFFLFPLLYILGSWTGVEIIKNVKNFYIRYAAGFIFVFVLLGSVHWSFVPKSQLMLPYTSPLVDFESAYATLPDNARVISGFPMLCEWYYAQRGECSYALAINYTGLSKTNSLILKRGEDNYTNIPYLKSLEILPQDKDSYFVIDSLSLNGIIDTNLRDKILEKGKIIYNSGQDRENIIIIKY